MGGETYDVIVVGAGMGGLYAVHRFTQQGLKVLCLEQGSGIGGVWRHNRYPGARVDLDSADYSYFFSAEIYREWRWTERYATQGELLAYLNYVADKLSLRQHIRLDTPMTGARWRPDSATWRVTAGDGEVFTTRFLVMCTGNLSEPRPADTLPGLANFKGEWVQTSRWPDREIKLKGRRIGIVGTGSSGVQAVPVLAEQAEHLYVFQRTANYSVPAQNGPADVARYEAVAADVPAARAKLFTFKAGTTPRLAPPKPYADYTDVERLERMERQWAEGGQGMNAVFADQQLDMSVNDVASEFVRNKVRAIVRDPVTAETLCAKSYPLGTKRLCLDIGYYEAFNRDNVTLVDVAEQPIVEITETGVRTTAGHYEVDLLVLALGFRAFTGVIDRMDIRNQHGQTPTSGWERGPRTLLGLMVGGFPNFFTVTGAGSPSVLANMFLINEYHADWIADCIAHMNAKGFTTIEPEDEAMDRWTVHATGTAGKLLRLQVNNYLVHVNADGSRVYFPYAGGLGPYVQEADAIAAQGYAGFRFARSHEAGAPGKAQAAPAQA